MDEHNASLVTADMQAKVEEALASITRGALSVHNYTDDETCPAVSF
jgi:basic membrane protein A